MEGVCVVCEWFWCGLSGVGEWSGRVYARIFFQTLRPLLNRSDRVAMFGEAGSPPSVGDSSAHPLGRAADPCDAEDSAGVQARLVRGAYIVRTDVELSLIHI